MTVLRAAVPSETVERVNGVVTHFTPPPKGGSGMDRSARRYRCSQDRQPHALAVPHSSPEAGGLASAGPSVAGPSVRFMPGTDDLATGGAPDWSLSNRERKAAHVTPQGGQTKRCNVAGALRRMGTPATWRLVGEPEDASSDEERIPMSRPTPLSTVVEEANMEVEALWRRALADGHVSHDEAIRIYRVRSTQLAPHLAVLTQSMHVIAGIAGGSAGVDSPSVKRTLRERWQRAAATVVPFRRTRGGDGPHAA